jgi:hypothetical protein
MITAAIFSAAQELEPIAIERASELHNHKLCFQERISSTVLDGWVGAGLDMRVEVTPLFIAGLLSYARPI